MANRISRRVVAGYLSYGVKSDAENAQDLWDDMVKELPKKLMVEFRNPKEHNSGEHRLEKEVKLDGNEVGIFLRTSYNEEDDEDEDGKYRTVYRTVEYWMNCELGSKHWSAEGNEMDSYELDLKIWLRKIRELYPDIAEKYEIR